MKAVGHRAKLPITDPSALIDFDAPKPSPGARDLLVRIAAVAVNPVDWKVRTKFPLPAGETRILGWDACGTVEAVGPGVARFKPGDQVYYAGSLVRPGFARWPVHIGSSRQASRAASPSTLRKAQASLSDGEAGERM